MIHLGSNLLFLFTSCLIKNLEKSTLMESSLLLTHVSNNFLFHAWVNRAAGQQAKATKKEGPRQPRPVFSLHFIWFSLRVSAPRGSDVTVTWVTFLTRRSDPSAACPSPPLSLRAVKCIPVHAAPPSPAQRPPVYQLCLWTHQRHFSRGDLGNIGLEKRGKGDWRN